MRALTRADAVTGEWHKLLRCMSPQVAQSGDPGMSALAPLGWLTRHESGTYVRFTEAGPALFA